MHDFFVTSTGVWPFYSDRERLLPRARDRPDVPSKVRGIPIRNVKLPFWIGMGEDTRGVPVCTRVSSRKVTFRKNISYILCLKSSFYLCQLLCTFIYLNPRTATNRLNPKVVKRWKHPLLKAFFRMSFFIYIVALSLASQPFRFHNTGGQDAYKKYSVCQGRELTCSNNILNRMGEFNQVSSSDISLKENSSEPRKPMTVVSRVTLSVLVKAICRS